MTPASLPTETLPPVRPWWTALVTNRAALISALFLALSVAASLVGPALYASGLPADRQPLRDGLFQDYEAVNGPPSAVHWLGADYLGRDTLTRLMLAARVSLIVALVVESLNVGLGGVLGLVAGYFGGWADAIISRLADVLFAFPGLLLAILVSAVFGETARTLYGGVGRLLLVAGSLSLVSWPLMARYVRSEVLSIKGRDYILAARSLGASGLQIIVRHLLPNVAWLIIVAATLDVAGVVVNEATLSLLGLGIEEPGASLGLMIFRASSQIERFPAQTLYPAILITALVLAFSFLGDGLRDVFDPNSAR